MKLIAILLICLSFSACCDFPITDEQKRLCLRDDLAKNWGEKFPELSTNITPDVELQNPDLHLSINEPIVHSLLNQALKGLKIDLSIAGGEKLKGDYIIIRNIKNFDFTDKGFISVDIEASAHLKKLFSKITFVIDELSLNIMPTTFKGNDEKEYIALFAAIDYLDIRDVPANLDRAIANLATYSFTKNKEKNAALIDSIEKIFKHEIHHPDDGRILNPLIKDTSILVRKDNIILQIASN